LLLRQSLRLLHLAKNHQILLMKLLRLPRLLQLQTTFQLLKQLTLLRRRRLLLPLLLLIPTRLPAEIQLTKRLMTKMLQYLIQRTHWPLMLPLRLPRLKHSQMKLRRLRRRLLLLMPHQGQISQMTLPMKRRLLLLQLPPMKLLMLWLLRTLLTKRLQLYLVKRYLKISLLLLWLPRLMLLLLLLLLLLQ
jgi:hypothetical protein